MELQPLILGLDFPSVLSKLLVYTSNCLGDISMLMPHWCSNRDTTQHLTVNSGFQLRHPAQNHPFHWTSVSMDCAATNLVSGAILDYSPYSLCLQLPYCSLIFFSLYVSVVLPYPVTDLIQIASFTNWKFLITSKYVNIISQVYILSLRFFVNNSRILECFHSSKLTSMCLSRLKSSKNSLWFSLILQLLILSFFLALLYNL